MVNIYVLKLREGKYYIGRTNDSERRASEHYFGDICSSWWVKKYGYVEMIENIRGDVWDEDKYVIKYMCKYGIDNVRGGSFSQAEINENERNVIEKMFRNASDMCFGCGEKGHFVKFCPRKSGKLQENSDSQKIFEELDIKVDKDKLEDFVEGKDSASAFTPDIKYNLESSEKSKLKEDEIDSLNRLFSRFDTKENLDIYVCLCQEEFLNEEDYNKHVRHCIWNGSLTTKSEDIKDKCNICIRCGRLGHTSEMCYAKTNADGEKIMEKCIRCGRFGHKIETCYAKFHINGKVLTFNKNK